MNITDILSEFEKIQNWGNATLTAVCCLACGYAWRFARWKWFPNDAIPPVVMLTGAILFAVLAGHGKDQPDLNWHVRAVMVGFIIGFAVVMVHNYAIKKLEDWLSLKLGLTDSTKEKAKE
jgi:ATP/ADP translocase